MQLNAISQIGKWFKLDEETVLITVSQGDALGTPIKTSIKNIRSLNLVPHKEVIDLPTALEIWGTAALGESHMATRELNAMAPETKMLASLKEIDAFYCTQLKKVFSNWALDRSKVIVELAKITAAGGDLAEIAVTPIVTSNTVSVPLTAEISPTTSTETPKPI